MGDIKRKRRKYSRPKKLFDSKRIEDENNLALKYGLKNRKEIWKARSAVSRIRKRAKGLISKKDDEEKNKFFEKLNKMGFKVKDISDVLALTEEDWLNRRLETFVLRNKLANTTRQARQLIVHKHVAVNGKIVNIPSFMVTTDLEDKISLKIRKQKAKKVKVEEKGEENE